MRTHSPTKRSIRIFNVIKRPTLRSRRVVHTTRHTSNIMQARPFSQQQILTSRSPLFSQQRTCSLDSFQCSTPLPPSRSHQFNAARNDPIPRRRARVTTGTMEFARACQRFPRRHLQRQHNPQGCSFLSKAIPHSNKHTINSSSDRHNNTTIISRCRAMGSGHLSRWRSLNNITTTVYPRRHRFILQSGMA